MLTIFRKCFVETDAGLTTSRSSLL